MLGPAGRRTSASFFYEGVELVRRAARRGSTSPPAAARASRSWSASRCACSSCAGTSTAGTTTARRTLMRRPRRHRRERQDRRATTTRRSRQAAHEHRRPTQELLGTADPGARRPAARTAESDAAAYTIPNTPGASARRCRCSSGYLKRGDAARRRRAPQTALRGRADDRRARVRGEDGPGRVPPAEHHRRALAGRALNAAAQAANWQPRVSRPRTSRTRNVVTGRGVGFGRHGSSALLGDRRRHRGEQEDRQDRRQAPLQRAGRRPRRSTRRWSRTR